MYYIRKVAEDMQAKFNKKLFPELRTWRTQRNRDVKFGLNIQLTEKEINSILNHCLTGK